MFKDIKKYLNEVRIHLHLDLPTEKKVLGELYSYFEDKVTDLKSNGLSEKKAVNNAIESCGQPNTVGRLMYEAYSKGTWFEAFFTALPHLICAALFATHLWYNPLVDVTVFSFIVTVTLFGWWKQKPKWLYSWIGYSLFPLLLVGYLFQDDIFNSFYYMFKGQGEPVAWWFVILIISFYVLAAWILLTTTIRVVKRDWILASLMLVPVPIMGVWLFNINREETLIYHLTFYSFNWDNVMAWVLLLLGIGSTAFIRLRQRKFKVGALITFSILTMTVVAHDIWGDVGFFSLLIISVFLLCFFLSPALLKSKIDHNRSEEEKWWSQISA